ncbi:TIR domain-containing adapter molecule 1 isoform 2-T5 [Anableps anableps]
MDHTDLENQGTGLRDVFDILVKAPSERLLSLTIQQGESPEDTVIHALCLIILQRGAQALRKLQMLEDNPLANHLAEKWHSGGVSFQGDKAAAESSGNPTLNPFVHLVSGSKTENVPAQIRTTEPQHTSAGTSPSEAEKDIKIDEASTRSNKSATQPHKPNTETKSSLPSATHIILPNSPGLKSTHISKVAEEEEEEEDIFYAFVILHAPEDSDMADSMKEKLEAVIGTTGATFSEDFAIPGKSTLKCVEDAINNSAFTFLLLTRNFNSQMVEMKTNMALINSINNEHKFNTVIPLLPLENCMPKHSIPIALKTLVALDERKNFERRLQKVFNRAKIEKHRKIWTEEQRMRKMRMQEKEMLRLCMEQRLVLGASVQREQDGGDPRLRWQPNIHIENANYILIGNDSTMTVGVEGSADKDGLS